MSMMDMLGSQQSPGRATRGRTPIFRIMLGGDTLDVIVQDATITTGENMHDTGELTVTSSDRTTTEGILELPISFLYGMAPKTETFCGYVTSVTEVQNDTGVLTFKMGFTGPTKPMQSGSPRFWLKRSIPNAIETLAYVSYLGYSGHDHTHLWPTLAQTEDSDWQMAVKLATRLGWSVFNRYGVVLLYDPLKLFQDQGAAVRLISETYTLAKSTLDEERSLLEFDPTEDAESSTEQQGYKVAYFNNGGMQVALQKGDHSTYRFITDFVIRDAEEASLYVNSKDSDASKWNQSAKARIMGNATLFPGMTVDILTTNSKVYTGKFNGRWLIRGVQHKMDRQSYQSNLMLARPDSTIGVSGGTYTPFWQSAALARPTLSLSNTISLQNPIRAIGLQPGAPLDWPERISPSIPGAGTAVWMSSWANSTMRAVAS